ncbi:PhoX family phosphatase [Kocuria sp.]|uniref:PhoX family protein n=1 Tax=Kocuria sp. TaxID=1871328 RepID=UPI002811995E|nr:PhoX family phosphatase [Kocuria sp.]
MTETAKRTFLPMLGHARGKRSPLTCQLKCGNACAMAECNHSDNGYFRDIASAALTRRSALGLGAAAAVTIGVVGATPEAAQAGRGRSGLSFTPIAPVPNTVDDLTVPEGFDWSPIIRWGDPLFTDTPEFDPRNQTAAAQAGQFGYNSDYLDIIPDRGGRTGVLVNNHEYTNENIMFPAEQQGDLQRVVGVAMAAHGMSVVEIARTAVGQPWSYVRGGKRNRRITLSTPFRVDGPAAGSDLLKTKDDPTGTLVLGTQNNCAGGTTPWGTVLSGEENFNQYFKGNGSAEQKRYGISTEAPSRRWHEVDPRFDSTLPGYENEPNRFGWVVEIDPQDPDSTPVKHTNLGRFKHEGANVRVAEDGTVVAYSGDDERFDYLYKFVSAKKYREGDRAHNMTLLSEGDLYVAKFTGDTAAEIDGSGRLPSDGAFDGAGQWLPLVVGGESAVEGMSVEEVLVHTRLAADKAGATKMDRPEDVEPSPHTGKVYVALTNNTQRGTAGKAGPDEANPRTQNRDGHIVELTERGNRADATEFGWNILLVAGDPAKNPSVYFSGFPADKVSPISCPDNLAFDSQGNLWISTDGAPGTIGYNDGLYRVGLTGGERGNVRQFLAVPQDAETSGPVIHDWEGMVYVSVQHPGEDGTFEQPRSYFPDYVLPTRQADGEFALPRPSVAQVFAAGRGRDPQFPGEISDAPGRSRNRGKRRKNGERGPRYRGYRGKATPETKKAAKAAGRSY